MMPRFQVIVPVMVPELYYELLESIKQNSLQPKKILLINNSDQEIEDDLGLPVEVLWEGGNLGVNKAWNLGVSALSKCEYVSVLNDDILLPETFFSRLVEFFKIRDADRSVDKKGRRYPCGVVCPHTVGQKYLMERVGLRSHEWARMTRREGWAFTIKKSVLDRIQPIPECFTNFFGDDWFWRKCHKMGQFWFKDRGNVVFHHRGVSCTLVGRDELRKQRFREYQVYTKMKEKGTF